MKLYTIEIDEIMMNYLKSKAEPFDDTPNSVLHRLLFKTRSETKATTVQRNSFNTNIPKALSQVLDVIYEVRRNGKTRPRATSIVAEKSGTTPQTIIDKYCRQLGKKSADIDVLLSESDLGGFKMILTSKFPRNIEMIENFFSNLYVEKGDSVMIDEPDVEDLIHSSASGGVVHNTTRDNQTRKRHANDRMSAFIENERLYIEFVSGKNSSFKLPQPWDKAAVSEVTENAMNFVRQSGGSLGQVNAARKALTDAGYHIRK